MKRLLPLIACLCVLSLSPGCATMTPEQREAALATTNQQQVNLDAAKAKEAAALAAAPTGSAEAERAAKNLRTMEQIQLALNAVKAGLENPSAGGGFNWESIGGSVVPYVPFPFNLIVGGGIAAVALWKARQAQTAKATAVKQEAISHAIVNAVDTAEAAKGETAAPILESPVVKAELAKTDGAHEFVANAKA